jgi:hypothetical protein
MATGMIATLTFNAGTGGTATAGTYLVTVSDANTFTITDSASGTITGSPSCSRTSYYGNSRVRGSETIDGNLSVGKDVSVTGNASVTGTLSLGGNSFRPLTRSTEQATTSGTSIDFSSIPSGIKRITVIFNGVSTGGTSMPLVRLGTSGAPTVSGYVASAGTVGSSSNSSSTTTSTVGFLVSGYSNTVSDVYYGNLVVTNVSGNTWICSGVISRSGTSTMIGGSVTLSGVLDFLRLTTTNGTDSFDAGTVNIMYE